MTDIDMMIRMKAADIAISLMQLCDTTPVDYQDALDQYATVFGNVERSLRNGVVEVEDDSEDCEDCEDDDERLN